jgi:oxygen-independent coproporphyrinogen III oxidase
MTWMKINLPLFDNTLLKFLNRAHNSTTAINSFHLARQAGFENISVDLIFGIPGQSDTTLHSDVRQMLELNPDHVSCYSLTIEEKTVFGRWSKTGKIKSVEDDVAARHLEHISDTLIKNGFEHYEVSNFSKPGFQSKHNTSYWRRQPYLGIGPSAHSFNIHSRQFNISNNHLYISSISKGEIPCEMEVLSKKDQINEYILTTLRTSWGCDLTVLQKDFNYNLLEDQSEYISTLLNSNLAITSTTHLILTKKGRLLADKISSDLFLLTT